MVDCRKPGCNGKLQANGPVVVCPSCRSVNCLKCTAVHEGMSCKEYMRSISADVSQVQRTVNRGDQKLTQQSAAPLPSTSAATPGPSSKKTPMAPPAVTTDNDSSEMLANCMVEECKGIAFVDKDVDMFRCQLCNHYTCVKCSAVHESMTCADYQRNKDNVPVPVFKPAASSEEGDEDSDSQEEQPEANGDVEGMIVECRYEVCAGYAYVVKTATTAQCELCKHWTCVACKVCHESQTCDQYKGIDVPAETMARQPPVPSKASQIPARSGTRKQKQENGAGNSGGGIFSAAMKSLFSRKAADAQSEPEGAKAAADNSSVATRAAQLGLYRDAKIVQENTCDACNRSGNLHVAEECEHNLCSKCIKMAVEKCTVDQIVACPAKGSYTQQQCPGLLKEHEYKDHVSQETIKKMKKKSNWVPAECFDKKCSTQRISFRIRKGIDFYVCPRCRRRNCWPCRAIHDGMTCAQHTEKVVADIDAGRHEDPHEKEKRLREHIAVYEQDVVSTSQEFECAICVVEVEPGKGIVLKNCHHKICEQCLANTAKNSPTAEVQCPCLDEDAPCQMAVFDSDLRACLSKEDYNALQDRSLREAENRSKEPSFHCKTPDCRGWCFHDRDVELFQCPLCDKQNCLRCEAIHEGLTCAQYQEDLKIRAENDAAAKASLNFLEEMLRSQQAMRCPQCRVVIIKRSGCDFMVCTSCQTQLCWATRGARWGPNGVGDTSGGCRCGVGGVKCHPTCTTCH